MTTESKGQDNKSMQMLCPKWIVQEPELPPELIGMLVSKRNHDLESPDMHLITTVIVKMLLSWVFLQRRKIHAHPEVRSELLRDTQLR